MKHQIGASHRRLDTVAVAHVAQQVQHARVGNGVAHGVLLRFVTAQHPHLAAAAAEQPAHHHLPEAAGATCHQDGAAGEIGTTRWAHLRTA